MPTPLCVATTNPGKLKEIVAIVGPLGFDAIGLADRTLPDGRPASALAEPVENGETFENNARIKSLAYAAATGTVCLADDSGLEVQALQGAPGVHSAYYAGDAATRSDDRLQRDNANNHKLLQTLKGTPDGERDARFVCVLSLAAPDAGAPGGARELVSVRGELRGVVVHEPRGDNGFGYDPLVELPCGKTSAEHTSASKNKVSHRARALQKLAQKLRDDAGLAAAAGLACITG